MLIVPAAVAEVVRQERAEEIAANEAAGPRFVEALGGGGFVAEFAVRLRPGISNPANPQMLAARSIGQNSLGRTTGMPLHGCSTSR